MLSGVPLVEPLRAIAAARTPGSAAGWSPESAAQEAEDQDEEERDEQQSEGEAMPAALDDDGCPAFDRVASGVSHLDDLDPVSPVPIAVGGPERDGGDGAQRQDEYCGKDPATVHYTDPSGWNDAREAGRWGGVSKSGMMRGAMGGAFTALSLSIIVGTYPNQVPTVISVCTAGVKGS